ncbi:MAG: hypothetical protein ABI791_06840 [Acidobacteriota bacterium]
METLLNRESQGPNRKIGLIVGALVGIVAIGLVIWLASFRPSMDEQMSQVLEGSFREGSPEFAQITKDIIISTGDNTVQSPNGFGRISMYIEGTIRNKGDRVINGLEINCAVITQFGNVLKEKRVLVVPTKQELLAPGQTITINTQIDGFDKDDDRANIRWKVTAIRVQH